MLKIYNIKESWAIGPDLPGVWKNWRSTNWSHQFIQEINSEPYYCMSNSSFCFNNQSKTCVPSGFLYYQWSQNDITSDTMIKLDIVYKSNNFNTQETGNILKLVAILTENINMLKKLQFS